MIAFYLFALSAAANLVAAPPSTDPASSAAGEHEPHAGEPAASVANLASYVSDGDYPPEAIRSGQQGTVTFRLHITPEGRVGRCEVVESSGSPALDATTCRIMTERPRFKPARDSSGRAVADTLQSRIRWVLPDGADSPPPPAIRASAIGNLAALVRPSDYPAEAVKEGQQGPSAVALLVAPDGKAADCRVIFPSGSTLLDDVACRLLRERARFTPARYADGSAAWDVVPVVVQWPLPSAR